MPDLGIFLTKPKMPKHIHQQPRKVSRKQFYADMVRSVRAIWMAEFKKQNRANDENLAEHIIAERYKLDVDYVRQCVRKHPAR